MFLKLAGCDWVRSRHNLLITGPCGVGKSWLACALGQKACREDLSTAYHRVPRLFSTLAMARADGRYARMLRQIAKVDLLILDDWGPETLTADQRRDLLEIIDDRHEMRSVIITSQVPIGQWYEIIGNPTIADAVLDRLVHNAYRIELTGESLRKKKNPAPHQHPNLTPNKDPIIIHQDPTDDAQVAGIKSESLAGLISEWVAGFELECMADFIGIRSFAHRMVLDHVFIASTGITTSGSSSNGSLKMEPCRIRFSPLMSTYLYSGANTVPVA